jgi:hypothetical protein
MYPLATLAAGRTIGAYSEAVASQSGVTDSLGLTMGAH